MAVLSVNYEYRYNPYTGKRDRTLQLNQSGNEMSMSNLTVNDVFALENPVTQSPNKCYWQYYNGTHSICESITSQNVSFGDVNVSGDLIGGGDGNFSGNLTGNQIYGEMWNYTANVTTWTFTISAEDVYHNLTGLIAGNLNGFSHTQGGSDGAYLTAEMEGLYKADLAFSFEGVSNNQLYAIAIVKNYDVTLSRNCYSRRWVSNNAVVGSVTVSCLLDLAVNDKVVVQVENEAGTGNIKVHAVNLNLFRIGD